MAAATSVTQSDQNRKIISTFGETDTKAHNNLMALTAEGNIKGFIFGKKVRSTPLLQPVLCSM